MPRLPTIGEQPYGPVFIDWLLAAHNSDGSNKSVAPVFNVKDPQYAGGAKGDGVADDTAPRQAAIDACYADGGGIVFHPRGAYKGGNLIWKPRVILAGVGTQDFDNAHGSILLGTAGTNILSVETNTNAFIRAHDLMLYGGKNQIVFDGPQTAHVALDDVVFYSPSESGIRVLSGAVERMVVRRARANGGQYFYKHDNVVNGGFNYLDKTHFEDCVTGGQLINAYRIEASLSNSVTWTNPNITTSGQHGLYARGGIRDWLFIRPNTEGIGQTGKHNPTTLSGVVTAGATSATLASATGWATGDGMTIAGAGTNGTDFTILSTAQGGPGVTISGTTVSWTGGTGTTVTNPVVTNAEWDEFNFADFLSNNPAGIIFLGGAIAGVGSNAKLRYAANFAQCNSVQLINTVTSDLTVPIYDPNWHVNYIGTPTPGAELRIRRPSGINQAYPVLSLGAIKVTTKAGTPTDADFTDLPANGTIVVDTTGNKIWTRIGGTWKGVTVA